MDNIILIGMPGAGKSTIGSELSKICGYEFLDTDDLIIEYTKRPLQETINSTGVEEFLDVERDAILTLKDINHTVISTGGSVIYREKSMEHLRSLGTVVYLRLPFCVIMNRIKNPKTRGIAIKKGQTFKDLYDERIVLYDKYAHKMINCNNKRPKKAAELICSELGVSYQ